MPERTTTQELIFYLVIAAAMTLVITASLVALDAFDFIYEYTRSHEDMELDELILGIAAALFSLVAVGMFKSVNDLRRYREAVEARRKLEKELEHRQRLSALGTLLGGMAHSLNNYLLPIEMLCGLTRDGLDTKLHERERQHLGKVLEATKGAKSVVAEALTFARADASGEQVDLNTALRHALVLVDAMLPPTANVSKAVEPGLGVVDLSLQQVQTIMLLLVQNALDAADDEVSIEIRAERDPKGAIIKITDDGPGIPLDIMPRIFEPFFTTKPQGEGTGLGLSTVYGHVNGAGGNLRAENVATGGARFILWLPSNPSPAKGS